MSDLIDGFRALLGEGAVLTGEAVVSNSMIWGHEQGCEARALLRPKTPEQVSEILRLCHKHGQTVVPHGGLTGLVDGAVTHADDVILSLQQLDQIEDVDPVNRTMTVQAGVPLERVQQAAEAAGLMFAVDLGARGSATIGGNIATNAGGLRVIRYGMMRENVLGLEAVLADGSTISSMSRYIKNNTGYDLKQLFIGSEGTLGVVTRAVLRLRQAPISQCTALIACPDFDSVTRLLGALEKGLGGMLSTFEVMWPEFYALVTTAPARGRPPLAQDHPLYVLTEAQGSDQMADMAHFETLLMECSEAGMIEDAAVAQSRAERNAFWALREDVEQLWRFAPIANLDVSLPIGDMPAYVTALQSELRRRWPDHRCFVFGHLGDGNLHVVISTGSPDPASLHAAERVVYEGLAPFQGSISAEHGIGIERRDYLSISRSPTEIGLMRTLKQALDPRSLLNPGKIISPT